MDFDGQSARAQSLVNAWLLRQYRHTKRNEHLRQCPEATASETDGGDGVYGCDTGCEYMRLHTVVQCPHGFSDAFTYGEFGDLAWIVEDLLALADESS